MSYPNFPATLPLPLRDGYGINDQSAILRTTMADGLARQRRRFANPPGEIPVQWSFTAEQHALFRGFLEYECAGGADWFSLRILFPGEGLKEQTVRLKPSMKSKLWGLDTWIVNVTLEIKAQPVVGENYYFEQLISPISYDEYTSIIEHAWGLWIKEQ